MSIFKQEASLGDMHSIADMQENFLFQSISDYVIIFLMVSVSFIISQLFILRLRKNFLESNKKIVQFKTYGFLSEIVFSDDKSDAIIDPKIHEFKSKVPIDRNWCKDLLIQNIIDLDKNFKGQSSDFLLSLYFKLELHEYTDKLVNSNIWYLKAKGIYYLRELKYTQAAPKIYTFLNHSHPELRSAALLAFISLSEDDNPLGVVKEYMDTISYVEMLNLMHIIQRRKFQKPENLTSWLSLKDDSHVVFALKLIVYFNDLESGKQVTELLNSKNSKVRLEAIKSIGKLFFVEAEQDLIVGFMKENEENQIETILTLKEIGGQDSIQFLHHLLGLNRSSEINLTAMYALQALDKSFAELQFDPEKSLDQAKKHVESPYLEI